MTEEASGLSDEDIARLWGALRSELNKLSVQNIRNTAAAAGIDVTQVPAKSEARSGLGSRAEVMPALDRIFGQMSRSGKITSIRILAEGLVSSGDPKSVHQILAKNGFQFMAGNFVPVSLFDARESAHLTSFSTAELAKAAKRLADGDETGAITAACGAVDTETQRIYQQHPDLGDAPVSFSTKVNSVLVHLNVYDGMQKELEETGMNSADAAALVTEIRKATNHASQAL